MTIQIYGRFDGYWSHAQVSRGIVKGLLANGVRGLRLHNVGAPHDLPPDQVYTDLPPSAVVGYNSTAEIGFYIGGYPPFAAQWLQDHPVRGALFIGESETLPSNWAAVANDCARVFVPSEWCKSAYRGIGVRRIDVLQHGIDEAFGEAFMHAGVRPLAGPLRILHVSGAASFLDRKGTPQLLEAFKRVFPAWPAAATLTIRTPKFPGAPIYDLMKQFDLGESESNVIYDGREACSPAQMAAIIALHHVVVQPSRAEAFGLVPVEARALGVPVLLTPCSGHSEHFEPDDGLIENGPSTPIVVNGVPAGGRAPSVSVAQVVKALRMLTARLPHWTAHARRRAADGYAARWSWERKTRLLADWLQYQQRKLRRAGRTRGGRDLNEL